MPDHSTSVKHITKRLIQGAFLLSALYLFLAPQSSHESDLKHLYQQQISNQWVEFEAKVTRLLADDNEGSRHQKFIVEHGSQTVLIAHNIDLAPRVPIKVGDELTIAGEYEWNERGGVVHWTHHDPKNRHAGGWIEKAGRRYR